jgi:hypothetical protein
MLGVALMIQKITRQMAIGHSQCLCLAIRAALFGSNYTSGGRNLKSLLNTKNLFVSSLEGRMAVYGESHIVCYFCSVCKL